MTSTTARPLVEQLVADAGPEATTGCSPWRCSARRWCAPEGERPRSGGAAPGRRSGCSRSRATTGARPWRWRRSGGLQLLLGRPDEARAAHRAAPSRQQRRSTTTTCARSCSTSSRRTAWSQGDDEEAARMLCRAAYTHLEVHDDEGVANCLDAFAALCLIRGRAGLGGAVPHGRRPGAAHRRRRGLAVPRSRCAPSWRRRSPPQPARPGPDDADRPTGTASPPWRPCASTRSRTAPGQVGSRRGATSSKTRWAAGSPATTSARRSRTPGSRIAGTSRSWCTSSTSRLVEHRQQRLPGVVLVHGADQRVPDALVETLGDPAPRGPVRGPRSARAASARRRARRLRSRRPARPPAGPQAPRR